MVSPEPANPSAGRIKRRMTGRTHSFFAVTAPGLAPLCRQELAAPPLSVPEPRTVPGGVLFSGRLPDMYRANLHLRTASRVLLRVAEFRADNFRELERRLARLDWELYLPSGQRPVVRVHSSKCRLYHSTAVAERVSRYLAGRLGEIEKEAARNRHVQTVFLRCTEDRFTLSVDTSGELLYRRGIKIHGSEAPLRETLAAAVLLWAGYRPSEPLLDPMCGSGTFALEAALMARRIAPGSFRTFAFEAWPSFRAKQWAFIRGESQKGVLQAAPAPILAGDADSFRVKTLRQSAAQVGIADSLEIFCADFFTLRPKEMAYRPGLVVLNPPYGRRLKTGAGLTALFKHLSQFYGGWKVALLAPVEGLGEIPFSHRLHRLSHGGLRLGVVVGRI